jgi:predicted phage terminase large subunit-like protein
MHSELKNLLRTDFLSFACKAHKSINGDAKLGSQKYLRLIAIHCEAFANGETKRLIVNLPPGHGKTFMCSVALSAWILAKNSAAKLLLVSYGETLAKDIAFKIRKILKSKWYRQTCRTRLAKDRTAVMDFATTAGGGVYATSIAGGVTGRRANYIIIDDPLEIKDHAHEQQIARVNDLVDSEISSRLDNPKEGGILLVQHRLNENDLSGHLQKQGGWKRLVLPLVAERRQTYHLGDDVWHRRKGELLRPDAFTLKTVKRWRSHTPPPGFDALYQQKVGGLRAVRIKREYFQTFPRGAKPNAPVVMSIDTALKRGDTNSWSVIQVWAYAEQFWLLDQWRDRVLYPDLRSACERLIRKFRPSVVLIEESAQGFALISNIKPAKGMTIVPIKPVESKFERLRQHMRVIRSGRILLPEGAAWVGEFIEEHVQFPNADHDDQVDATTQFLSWAASNPPPQIRPPHAICAASFASAGNLSANPDGSASPYGAASQIPGVAAAFASRSR